MSEKEFGSSPANYVDPTWDYLSIYRSLLEFQSELRNSIEFVGNQEIATAHSHANLAMQLEKMVSSLRLIQERLQ